MIKRIVNYLIQCDNLLSELSQKQHISKSFLWLDSAWALFRHGCLIKQYSYGDFYKVARPLMSGVITQRRLERIIRDYNNSTYIHLLRNKNEFNELFKQWIKREWLWSNVMSETEFKIFVNKHQSLFVKPLDDQEGHGIRILKIVNEKDIHQIYTELKDKNVLIEETIVQHPKMSFGNSAVNTVRIITCLDTENEVHFLRAALRVGVGDSIVDNFSAGGVLYDIDIQSGRIDNQGICHDGSKYIFHPGTNICMLGYQIPNWKQVLESVCSAAKMIPQCRFIGWDVAITLDGVELIEGNHNPGLFTMESVGKPCAYKKALNYLNS